MQGDFIESGNFFPYSIYGCFIVLSFLILLCVFNNIYFVST